MTEIDRALWAVTERWRGSQATRQFREILPNPSLNTDAATRLQLDLLRKLIAHASQHVPYYREVFAALGIRSADVRTLEDFAHLPVLTKGLVRERQRDLLADNYPIEKLTRLRSGGSTGVPLEFFHDAGYLQYSDAATYRAMSQCGWSPGDMIAFFWGWNERLTRMSKWEFELRQWLRRSYQFDPFQADEETFARWVSRWRRLRPTVAYGYASTVARFADFIRRSGTRVAPLKGVFTTAEKLYGPQREVVESVFDCHAYDCYGSSEIRNIATECRAGSMHVNMDYVVLETDRSEVDPTTGAAPFILTSLRSYGMPFLRYRNEDCGRLLGGQCACGGGFARIALDISRITDHFVFPGGRVVHGEFLTHLMYGARGVDAFQFHQTAIDEMVVWIVPSKTDAAGLQETIRSVASQLESMATPPLRVVIREVAQIPLSAAGKHRFTRSDVTPFTH